MKNLITLNYWFNLRPETLLPYAEKLFLGFLVLLLLAAIITGILKKRPSIYRGLIKRAYIYSLSNLAIGLVLLFINYESIPFFSARFWLGGWIIIMIIWLIYILKGLSIIPQQKKQLEQEKEFKKYIP